MGTGRRPNGGVSTLGAESTPETIRPAPFRSVNYGQPGRFGQKADDFDGGAASTVAAPGTSIANGRVRLTSAPRTPGG